jgi:hypothetical protein
MKIVVKEHPELRHVLAHIVDAVAALTNGLPEEAAYELDSIQSFVFWETDEKITTTPTKKAHHKELS